MMKETAAAAKNKEKGTGTNSSTLAGLLQEDYTSSGDSYFIDNAWRGAEVCIYDLHSAPSQLIRCSLSL